MSRSNRPPRPCARCGDESAEQWSGRRFGLAGFVCVACYGRLRRTLPDWPARVADRRRAKAQGKRDGRRVLESPQRLMFAGEHPEPTTLARGRALRDQWRVQCATPAEFALWYGSATSVGGERADLPTYCRDSADPAWCAAHQAAGTCALVRLRPRQQERVA